MMLLASQNYVHFIHECYKESKSKKVGILEGSIGNRDQPAVSSYCSLFILHSLKAFCMAVYFLPQLLCLHGSVEHVDLIAHELMCFRFGILQRGKPLFFSLSPLLGKGLRYVQFGLAAFCYSLLCSGSKIISFRRAAVEGSFAVVGKRAVQESCELADPCTVCLRVEQHDDGSSQSLSRVGVA